jgi:hypothetical protein
MSEVNNKIQVRVTELNSELLDLSHWIHAHPETAWQEFESSARVANVLRNHGFDVVEQVSGLPTAFRAEFGSGDFSIALCAEYDALPDCEKGPNGGRIMWFPPYDITLGQESSSPKFNQTNFLGRPEPVYTYENTSRSSSISWSIIVDHPSISCLVPYHSRLCAMI